MLAASLPVIEACWAKLNPPPTRKIPVLIGRGSEKRTRQIVGTHADIWHRNRGLRATPDVPLGGELNDDRDRFSRAR